MSRKVRHDARGMGDIGGGRAHIGPMSETYDLILRGGTIVTPGGEMQADIGIRGERIARIGDLSDASAGEIYGASGCDDNDCEQQCSPDDSCLIELR